MDLGCYDSLRKVSAGTKAEISIGNHLILPLYSIFPPEGVSDEVPKLKLGPLLFFLDTEVNAKLKTMVTSHASGLAHLCISETVGPLNKCLTLPSNHFFFL